MKSITIIVEKNTDGQIIKAEKMILWEEYQRWPWSTLSEIFHRTVRELDEEISRLNQTGDH